MSIADQVKMAATGPSAATVLLGAAASGFISLTDLINAKLAAVNDTYVQFYVEDGAGNWEVADYKIVSAARLHRLATIESNLGRQHPAVFPNGVNLAWMTEQGKSRAPAKNQVTATPSAQVYMPAVSQYERALIFAAPPRQGGAVKGFSRNFNDAQYCMTLGAAAANLVSDADIYDCEAGALTVGMSYNAGAPAAYSAKALAFQWRKMLWDLGAGESLFLQFRGKTVGATGNQTLFGNSNGTTEGFGIVLNLAGTLSFNFKGAGTAGQSIQIQGVQFDGTNVVSNTIATDTYFSLTIHVDGDTKKLDAWVNGIPAAGNTGGAGNGYGSGGTVLNAGSTIPVSPHNFGFGYIPADDSFTPSTVKPTRIQAFRMAVLPAGKKVRSPAFLDWLFNNNPRALFDDTAYFSE